MIKISSKMDKLHQIKPRHIILATGVLNIVLALGASTAAMHYIRYGQVTGFDRLLQVMASVITFVLGGGVLWATVLLVRLKPLGRYASLIVLAIAAVSTFSVLLNRWQVFNNFDAITSGIAQNIHWVLGSFLIVAVLYSIFKNIYFFRFYTFLTCLLGLWVLIGTINHFDFITPILRDSTTWGVFVFGMFVCFLWWRLLMLGDTFDETSKGRLAWQGWLFLAPNFVGFSVFFAGPLLYSLLLSFTDDTIGQDTHFVALNNYIDILRLNFTWLSSNVPTQPNWFFRFLTNIPSQLTIQASDPLFWTSLRNTLVLCVLLIPTSVVPALVLALMLNTSIRGMVFFRTLFFLPSIAAVVGTAIVWQSLYDPTIGLVNYAISRVVIFLNKTLAVSLQDPNIAWLTDPGVVLISVLLLAAWHTLGFNMVLFLAGLQAIPRHLYEAAKIDGANTWHQFWHVTLPMLAPTSLFVLVTTMINSLQMFNEPFILLSTDSPTLPPAGSTVVYYLYQRGFTRFEFGYASALAWVLFVIIFAITRLQFRLVRTQAYGEV